MRKSLIIILIALIALSGCKKADEQISETSEPTAAITSSPTAEALEEEATEETSVEYSMPSLPDLDYSQMSLFEDGYEVVEFKTLADGDTATFVVNGLPMETRFLAVDTPEINSSTDGMQPWSMAAKEYTQEILSNAEEIILELDEESDIYDTYDRLLAWVWVDGELLNYMLVEEGLAYVKYLYGDYKYNMEMIVLESAVQKTGIKIWGEDDPDYDYENDTVAGDIATIRSQTAGKNVEVEGVVTNVIGKNAFIQDDTAAIYIYANRYNYSALEIGNRVSLEGKVVEYNGLLEISDITDKTITLLEEGVYIEPQTVTLDMVGEDIEGIYIKIENIEVTEVSYTEGEKGYDVYVTDGTTEGIIRVDKYLSPYPEPSEFTVGEVITVVGNVGQYINNYQIMIGSIDDVSR